ncbi:MAG: diacylglycerol/lipid kinase family protein [Dissulfurispiraceae bacterium]|jgi:diacylglycerol kinase (ATP)
MSKRIVIIGNPIAGGGAGKEILRASSILKASGIDAELRFTARKGDAESFAREVSGCADTIVLAAGGDGTYNETANGLLNSDTPLAILPLGTTSVLARECAIPLNTEKALDIAINGRVELVHMGRISCRFQNAMVSSPLSSATPISSRHFLLMAGIGYDGESVYGVNERVKKYSGKMAYIISGIGTIINYHPGIMKITAAMLDRGDFEGGRFRMDPQYCSFSGNSMESTGYTVIVSKAACYGGDMKITPDASLSSPYLYIFISHKKKRLDLMRYLAAVIRGRVTDLKDISYFRTDSIGIEGDSHIQVDGDYVGKTPAKMDVVKNALKLLVPNS